MNSNLWGPPDRRAHMNHRSSSMPAGGGGGAFQMNSLGGSPMMGTGGMGMGGMGGGGTGGGIPMQSTQFRSGDGPSMSGFGPRFPHSSFLFKRFVKFNPRLFFQFPRPFRKITS